MLWRSMPPRNRPSKTMSATAAAAAAHQKLREEEEEMTQYAPQDLAEGWEFKILRSSTGACKRPERLQQFLAEEARMGWQMVEKFDNSRVRLKRPVSARRNDHVNANGIDPYRTHVGLSESKLAVLIVLGIVIPIIVVAVVAALIGG
jgi:hypothetical protein